MDNLSKDVTSTVYQIKVTAVDMVICILEPHLTELIFVAGSHYQLLDYSVVWMTLQMDGFVSHMDVKQLPWQWIDLRLALPQAHLDGTRSTLMDKNIDLIINQVSEGSTFNDM